MKLATSAMALLASLVAAQPGDGGGRTANGSTEAMLQYGEELPQIFSLGIGRCMDAALDATTLCVIGSGHLYVCDASRPDAPRVIGTLKGLGNVRQIVLCRGAAFITAREDGLFIVDIRDHAAPVLLAHYDTIELATGIEVSGDVAFVACRTYGVELVDVRNLSKPRHLSTVRTGEAQSCVGRNGLLYVGVRGSRELVVCDVRNPRLPTVISRTPLDGFGDGVDVRGTTCFVATGHHSRTMRRREESDPGFGRGHGLEIFDVSRPEAPRRISCIKMPRLYRLGMDMWDVSVSGEYAYVSDTYNGLFVVDISDLGTPKCVAYHQMAYVKSRKDRSPVGGFAVGKGVLYAAGAWTDLQVLSASMACPPVAEPDAASAIPPPLSRQDSRFQFYRPDGQVWAVDFLGDLAVAACGAAGLHLVRVGAELEPVAQADTEGLALDVKVKDGRVWVAEGKGGLTVWEAVEQAGGTTVLNCIGRFRARGELVRQVVLAGDTGLALLAVGQSTLVMVDVSDPATMKRVFSDKQIGLLYGNQITEGLFDNRYACCFWHVSGFHWYDLAADGGPRHSGDNWPYRVGSINGMALLPDGHRALATTMGKGYLLIGRGETRSLADLPCFGIPGAKLIGKPKVYGNTLYVADRYRGEVHIADITDLEKPLLLDAFVLDGNPGIIREFGGRMVIPAGYDGLLVAPKPEQLQVR